MQSIIQTPAGASLQEIGSSVTNRHTRPLSISETGRISLESFAWFTLAYNVAIVLWGAYVRTTASGAGCGSHWPLCNGELLPGMSRAQTVIEFTHRATSAVSLSLVSFLVVWCRRQTLKCGWPDSLFADQHFSVSYRRELVSCTRDSKEKVFTCR